MERDIAELQRELPASGPELFRCPNLGCQWEGHEPNTQYNQAHRRHQVHCPECGTWIRNGKTTDFLDMNGVLGIG